MVTLALGTTQSKSTEEDIDLTVRSDQTMGDVKQALHAALLSVCARSAVLSSCLGCSGGGLYVHLPTAVCAVCVVRVCLRGAGCVCMGVGVQATHRA